MWRDFTDARRVGTRGRHMRSERTRYIDVMPGIVNRGAHQGARAGFAGQMFQFCDADPAGSPVPIARRPGSGLGYPSYGTIAPSIAQESRHKTGIIGQEPREGRETFRLRAT